MQNIFSKIQSRLLKIDEIECRPKISQSGKTCQILLYLKTQTVRNILDETVGPENWQTKHVECNGKDFCELSIKNPETKEWITKSDCGSDLRSIEPGKSEASDALKRSALQWGIGSELNSLYYLPDLKFPLKSDEVLEKSFFNPQELDENGHPSRIGYFVLKDGIRFDLVHLKTDEISKKITELIIYMYVDNDLVSQYKYPNDVYIVPSRSEGKEEALSKEQEENPLFSKDPDIAKAVAHMKACNYPFDQFFQANGVKTIREVSKEKILALEPKVLKWHDETLKKKSNALNKAKKKPEASDAMAILASSVFEPKAFFEGQVKTQVAS